MLFSAQEGISVPPAIPGLPTGQNAAESLGTAGSDTSGAVLSSVSGIALAGWICNSPAAMNVVFWRKRR